jgi:hypothetical protein
MPQPDVMHALGKRQPAGILHVTAIDEETQRPHLTPRRLLKLDPAGAFQVNRGDLFACAQVGDRILPARRGDPKGDAAAHPAAVEAEHEAGPLRGTAMHEGIDA